LKNKTPVHEHCFFLGRNATTWQQKEEVINLTKVFREKHHNIAIFGGKKVQIARFRP